MKITEHEDDTWGCMRCSNCKWIDLNYIQSKRYSQICPPLSRFKFDSYSGQGKMDIARAIINDDLDPESSSELLDIIYKDPLCGGCDAMCKRNLDLEILDTLIALREWVMEKGVGPLPEHKEMLESTRLYNNPFGASKDERLRWMKDLDFEIKNLEEEEGEILLFAGCLYSLEPRVRDSLVSAAKILEAADVDFGVLGENERCCGLVQYRIGETGMFEDLAESNMRQFDKLGVDTIVTPCSHCYSSFNREYPKVVDMDLEVLHVVELIDQLLDEGSIEFRNEIDLKATWHDPCNMGRISEHWDPGEVLEGIYDAPRRILKSMPGVGVEEMERIKENTWCCGAGGGVYSAYPDFAHWTANERFEEAETAGAEVMATSCPWCELNFYEAAEQTESELKIKSLYDLVWESMR